MKKILIVDDEPLIRNFLKDALSRLNKNITEAQNGQAAIELIEKEDFDLIITDMKMPLKNGIDVLQVAKLKNPTSLVIIITAFASLDNAISALNLGAFTYLLKPFSIESLEAAIKKAEEYYFLIQENKYLRQQIPYPKNFHIVAQSPAMKKILKDIDKIAQSSSSVFISGESGTGKEIIAQAICYKSLRKKNPFIKVNCAAIPETLIESEFFGHERGSFTGAIDQKKGKFELAHRGTLLLDEITEIPLSMQTKLLRAIQEKEIDRIGSITPIKVDIRFIATSNRNIKDAIDQKIFREDLFYRLNVIPIEIPPLRERKEDILSLAEFYLEKYCFENHKPKKTLLPNAKEKLINYPWPGNIRELANIIERTVVLDLSNTISDDHIHLDYNLSNTNKPPQALAEVEKKHILQTLKNLDNNKTKTAKILGINLKTLRNKLKQFETSEQ